MSSWRTKERAADEQERRREFQKNVPAHFCPACSALTYENEETCFDCGEARPADGWPAVSASADPWLGQVVENRYLVTKHIATGANARVYRADSRIIPRSFAIKFMNVSGGPDLDKEGLRRRLRRGVEVLSSLRNPHIVGFYDVVELGHEYIAFVMDLIEGVPLEAFVRKEGPIDVVRALGLLRQLANGVYEAHVSGLLHLDLKPSNVMVEKLPAGDDFIRILDFGVVWVRGTADDSGAYEGSAVFASPEQLRGEELDNRADVYAIGALAFFLLTGKPPYDRGADLAKISRLPVPSLEDAARVPFPAAVEEVVESLLARNRADRPSDLSEVTAWLDSIIDEVVHDSTPALDGDFDSPKATAMGLIPTLGEASSPVLQIDTSGMSDVSEALVEEAPVAMACDGNRYAFVRAGSIAWVDEERHEVQWTPPSPIRSMALADDFVLFGLANGTITRVFRDAREETMFQDPRMVAMTAVATDRAGKTMVAGSESGRLYAYRGGTGWGRLGAGENAITALGLSAKGDQFAVARETNIQIFNTKMSHTPTFPLPVQDPVVSVAFSPDDYLIAVLTSTGTVVLESVLTGQEFMRLETGNQNLCDVTFSADNHIMGLFREGERVVLRALT